jgi:hypothetical protein
MPDMSFLMIAPPVMYLRSSYFGNESAPNSLDIATNCCCNKLQNSKQREICQILSFECAYG